MRTQLANTELLIDAWLHGIPVLQSGSLDSQTFNLVRLQIFHCLTEETAVLGLVRGLDCAHELKAAPYNVCNDAFGGVTESTVRVIDFLLFLALSLLLEVYDRTRALPHTLAALCGYHHIASRLVDIGVSRVSFRLLTQFLLRVNG